MEMNPETVTRPLERTGREMDPTAVVHCHYRYMIFNNSDHYDVHLL